MSRFRFLVGENRFYLTFKIPDRTAKSMFSDIEQLCRLFPKKTDLAAISDEDLNKTLYDINHRPQKYLAYRTACEALEDEFD